MTARQRVLVVEDDPEIRYLLTAILGAEGRDIVAVATGRDARGHLESGGFDLVILDLILPDVDGRSLLSAMRDRPETATVQVIVVTARGGVEARQDCYAMGADAFVEKPFSPDELVADVAVRLERAAQARASTLRDPLTGLLNRAGLQAARAETTGPFSLGLVEVDDRPLHGADVDWEKAERIVNEVARALRISVGDRATLGRVGGGDFALFAEGMDPEVMTLIASAALAALAEMGSPELGIERGAIKAAVGIVAGGPETSFDDAVESARRRIFQAPAGADNPVVTREGDTSEVHARVLIAEDDEISASILVHKLRKEGLEVVRYDNGEKALQAAIANPPDLMVLDVKMPGLDGFEVLDRVRRDARFDHTAVLMLTSMGQEADVVRGFSLGADDYVLKPFSPVELTARVRRLLKRGRTPKSA